MYLLYQFLNCTFYTNFHYILLYDSILGQDLTVIPLQNIWIKYILIFIEFNFHSFFKITFSRHTIVIKKAATFGLCL
jgi:hypothetical protein